MKNFGELSSISSNFFERDLSLVQALSGNTVTGAMTYSFIQAAQNEPGLTYGNLLNSMRHVIRDAKAGIYLNGPISTLLSKVLRTELSQVSTKMLHHHQLIFAHRMYYLVSILYYTIPLYSYAW